MEYGAAAITQQILYIFNFNWGKLKCIIFMVLLLFCMIKTTDIMQRKKSDFKYIPFFEQEENTDVLFMGTSHVINGIFPMELWNSFL